MKYDTDFYAEQRDGSLRSAEQVVPFLVGLLNPSSTLDIGCGVGTWPSMFARSGCQAHGMDGSWAYESKLEIPAENFTPFDFIKAPTPYAPELPLERYDLITTFEFAEHIFEELADPLVDFMCSKTDAVIFGAAIPRQGGTHHVNEQWPSYWAHKFKRNGFVPCDFIRPTFWNNQTIRPWYVQNTVGYFRGSVPKNVREAAVDAWERNSPLPLIHPSSWDFVRDLADPTFKNFTRQGEAFARKAAKKILGR
jgi:SAM-dependent methyltransferase